MQQPSDIPTGVKKDRGRAEKQRGIASMDLEVRRTGGSTRAYLAVLVKRASRTTVTLISPG